MRVILALGVAVCLSGCIARTAANVVTAPVRVGSQVADWATTSQDESDRARGRELREREERQGRLSRQRDRAARDCAGGSARACEDQRRIEAEIDALQAQPNRN
jgi:hypothetical protein